MKNLEPILKNIVNKLNVYHLGEVSYHDKQIDVRMKRQLAENLNQEFKTRFNEQIYSVYPVLVIKKEENSEKPWYHLSLEPHWEIKSKDEREQAEEKVYSGLCHAIDNFQNKNHKRR